MIDFLRDLDPLLESAPAAVESFFPGHWELMSRLERDARETFEHGELPAVVSFLTDVTVLKQPYRIDRARVVAQLEEAHDELSAAIHALHRVEKLDYRAMDTLAKVPWFGKGGGRSFASAVMRLLRPKAFAIIDWRNLAVLMAAPGFTGLVEPGFSIGDYTAEDVLAQKSHLKLSQPVYEAYNQLVRELAARHGKTAAQLDLALWTYSIQQRPFRGPPLAQALFTISAEDRRMLRGQRTALATRLVGDYLEALRDCGPLSRERVAAELRSILLFIRNECEAFGHGQKSGVRDKVAQVVHALDEAAEGKVAGSLLTHWSKWESMLNPSSSTWRGPSLPGSMFIAGYMVLEDFIAVRKYLEEVYDAATLEPRPR